MDYEDYYDKLAEEAEEINRGKRDYDSRIIQEDGLPYALGIENEAEVYFKRGRNN